VDNAELDEADLKPEQMNILNVKKDPIASTASAKAPLTKKVPEKKPSVLTAITPKGRLKESKDKQMDSNKDKQMDEELKGVHKMADDDNLKGIHSLGRFKQTSEGILRIIWFYLVLVN